MSATGKPLWRTGQGERTVTVEVRGAPILSPCGHRAVSSLPLVTNPPLWWCAACGALRKRRK